MHYMVLNLSIVLYVSDFCYYLRIDMAYSYIEEHPIVNDDLPSRILCGSVIIKPNIKEFTSDGHGVIFEDDTYIHHVDCVFMATGYNIMFPYLKENILSVKDNQVNKTIDDKEFNMFFFVGSSL